MLFCALGVGWAAAAGATDVTVPAGAGAEVCLGVTMADTLKYSFRSSAPVQFTIYYRQGGMVFHPVMQRNRRDSEGTMAPEAATTYCAEWQNAGDTEAVVSYNLETVRGSR